MLFEILWTFECLSTEFALMWFQWYMDPDMRCNMITLDGCCAAGAPRTGQA